MIWLWVISGICAGLLLIFGFVWINNSLLKTTRYTLNVENLESELKIVHISDLHGKSFGRYNGKLVSAVMKAEPDVIAITGDVIHKYREKDKRVALGLVSSLSNIAPVLYVSGNHEMRSREYRVFRRSLMDAGACVLDDCTRDICGITVVGLNCASLKNNTVFDIMPENGVRVLLAHMPHYFGKYAESGCEIVLSGHAHGGQWRIPFTDIGIYAPGQGLFPKLTSGVHVKGDTRMVVSRGLGNSRCPLRLFNRPELVVIELKSKN